MCVAGAPSAGTRARHCPADHALERTAARRLGPSAVEPCGVRGVSVEVFCISGLTVWRRTPSYAESARSSRAERSLSMPPRPRLRGIDVEIRIPHAAIALSSRFPAQSRDGAACSWTFMPSLRDARCRAVNLPQQSSCPETCSECAKPVAPVQACVLRGRNLEWCHPGIAIFPAACPLTLPWPRDPAGLFFAASLPARR